MTAAALRRRQKVHGVVGVGAAPLIWAAHFIAVYALVAASCAPRGLIAGETARILIAVFAVFAVALIAACARWAVAGGPGGVLGVGALWSAVISAIAVAAQTIPAALFDHCG